MDITIKVSDQGGGVDRVTAEKMFQYLYTTSPAPSLTAESVPLSGFGYGLPLSRLYARCSIFLKDVVTGHISPPQVFPGRHQGGLL